MRYANLVIGMLELMAAGSLFTLAYLLNSLPALLFGFAAMLKGAAMCFHALWGEKK